jgi:putative transposase
LRGRTHRCHDRQFLLKFEHDRQRWKYWLFQARKRYGLPVLNYIATSNHEHLLVQDGGRGEIARSMQLIAGRTAQEYNQRKFSLLRLVPTPLSHHSATQPLYPFDGCAQ